MEGIDAECAALAETTVFLSYFKDLLIIGSRAM